MEDGLRAPVCLILNSFNHGLNPCCYGRWSQRKNNVPGNSIFPEVLILVVMEDGLRENNARTAITILFES